MKLFRKAFLFLVGAVAIAYEEAAKSVEEASRSIKEHRKTFNESKQQKPDR